MSTPQTKAKKDGAASGLALATGSGLCIWRVRYDSRFESSSGMQRYHIDHKDCTGLVATEAEHLGAVRKAICDHIGPQSRLMALHEAHYLGCTLNDPNGSHEPCPPKTKE